MAARSRFGALQKASASGDRGPATIDELGAQNPQKSVFLRRNVC